MKNRLTGFSIYIKLLWICIGINLKLKDRR
jgi:hypothetical protein